jgi:ACT domain-containing protein
MYGFVVLINYKEKINMKAVITVVGHDTKGIIAKVSAKCADRGANITEISQSVLKEYFAMIMVIDITDLNVAFTEFVDEMRKMGEESDLDIRAMHEDIFNSMHRI